MSIREGFGRSDVSPVRRHWICIRLLELRNGTKYLSYFDENVLGRNVQGIHVVKYYVRVFAISNGLKKRHI